MRSCVQVPKTVASAAPVMPIPKGKQKSSQQTAEVRKQRTRLATAKQRVSELEVLLCKIYEDNILGELSDSRYATLDTQQGNEKPQNLKALQAEQQRLLEEQQQARILFKACISTWYYQHLR